MPNQEPAWIKLLAAVGAMALIVPACAALYLYPNIKLSLNAKFMARDDAFFWKTPVPLRDTSIAAAKGEPVTCAGVTFSAPWELAAGVAPRVINPHWVSIEFGTGVRMTVVTTAHGETVHAMVPRPNDSDGEVKFPFDITVPDYEEMRERLFATPATVKILTSRAKAAEASDMLVRKAMLTQEHAGEIFTVSGPRCRGFQLGAGVVSDRGIQLFLYSDKRNVQIRIGKPRPDVGLTVTQADVNLIVQTLRDAE